MWEVTLSSTLMCSENRSSPLNHLTVIPAIFSLDFITTRYGRKLLLWNSGPLRLTMISRIFFRSFSEHTHRVATSEQKDLTRVRLVVYIRAPWWRSASCSSGIKHFARSAHVCQLLDWGHWFPFEMRLAWNVVESRRLQWELRGWVKKAQSS